MPETDPILQRYSLHDSLQCSVYFPLRSPVYVSLAISEPDASACLALLPKVAAGFFCALSDTSPEDRQLLMGGLARTHAALCSPPQAPTTWPYSKPTASCPISTTGCCSTTLRRWQPEPPGCNGTSQLCALSWLQANSRRLPICSAGLQEPDMS